MFNIRVIKADLWGNLRDGFDNNGEYEIGSEEIEVSSDYNLLKIARDYFAGRFLARSENQSLPMTRRKIGIEYSYGDENEPAGAVVEINYDGTYIGNMVVTKAGG